ncbi:FAD-binding protein [Tahibacter amnicola]|uniref:FAD-binding protein n=1 Tax=Tahibacter amnicola TaxID=2976241 RepID=A0ABY6BGU9_9GAMM|nr:FAD-binding protein [Tahibacter amnicola]UXI68821.1 FAD-binding protein [Tahibacter amnicola]
MTSNQQMVTDVTGLYAVPVWAIVTPTSTADVQAALARTNGPVAIGGGRFSMGGQAASPGALHLDMRQMNQIVQFAPLERTVRVQAGVRWCDLQRFLDPHGLAVKIMQSYANFTVGGSLSVNVHGRYVGLGPLILSVRAIAVVLADGQLVEATPTRNSEIFYGAIGGYGGLGVIVEAELELAENVRMERFAATMPVAEYPEHFRALVRNSRDAIMHNADIYPPYFRRVRSVTWRKTDKPATVRYRLMPLRSSYPLHRYFIWAASETPLGKWRKQHIVDNLLYMRSAVHWRNFEAGYDVAELEPVSRRFRTFVLQEYFIPVSRFDDFVAAMREILQRHRVNVLNISIRHALPDPGSLMAWAREECFAFVLYYKQRTRPNACQRVAVWTRELIDAALDTGGTYYLPYQPHATPEQFARAYPRHPEMFALKAKIDPASRFRNSLWDTYYMNTPTPARAVTGSEFHRVYGDVRWRDAFYRFLQNIYRLYPEDRFHTLIIEACASHDTDEAIYRQLQERLPGIKPLLADLTYALPSLAKQKREMARQTAELVEGRRSWNGYVEIGGTGRYVRTLRREIGVSGDTVIINDIAPGNSPVDLVERGQWAKAGRFVPLNDYAPIAPSDIADASMDLVTCYIGLHHAVPETLPAFLASIHRIVRPGGVFILRDHDVTSEPMRDLVSLAHTVFNAGLQQPWSANQAELRHFESVATWSQRITAAGFEDLGKRLLQANDPTDNVLMGFRKPRSVA